MSEYILQMRNISKSFFGVKVLNNVSLSVKPGEVHVLLGENGAGKSTLIKILSGAYRLEEGEIIVNGENVKINDPKNAIDLGISVIYQEFNLNPYMSIYENIYLGKEKTKAGCIDSKALIAKTKEHLEAVGLNADPRTLIKDLSVAEKQMVEIAKALSQDVRVLVLDEPTAAITDTETEKLFVIVRELQKKGIGIIYISHRMSELFELGDRCTVLRDGEYIDTVYLKDVDVHSLTKMMVGRNVSFEHMKNPHCTKEKQVVVKNISYKNIVKDVSFDVKKGEIFGITGLVGAGRTELAKCMIGALKKDKGQVFINGKEVYGKSPKESIDKGMVYLSEDRKDEGLVLIHDIKQNICLPNLKKFGKFILSEKKQLDNTKKYIDKVRVKTSSPYLEAKNLSGGNQQKVVIAKWICGDSSVYIFDEPTRGIDVGARDEIYKIMHEIAATGTSIIMISSDLVEVLKISDRIMVMKEGRVNVIMDNHEMLTQQEVFSYAISEGDE